MSVKRYSAHVLGTDGYSTVILASDYDCLQRELADERERHAQLQARCFDGGGSQSVFDALAEARRDAERYRWLRDKSPAKWTIDVGDLPLFKFDLDAAIDAAMEQGHE
jgi:hypothetical protein